MPGAPGTNDSVSLRWQLLPWASEHRAPTLMELPRDLRKRNVEHGKALRCRCGRRRIR